MSIFTPYTLPSGLTLSNRIAKAAMEENLGTKAQYPSSSIIHLYKAWAQGGAGLIITGNVMIDPLSMTGPGGIALHKNQQHLAKFTEWADVAKSNGSKVVMQINHPGRQVFKNMQCKAISPSAVGLDLGKHSSMFDVPRAMSEADIVEVIDRFVSTATLAQSCGFDGVQIHAAHGYLVSQFLSPLVNKREDKWGGSLENRARLLRYILENVRKAVGMSFSLSVKLNSADFQRGGFDVDDATTVVKMLEAFNLDFIELSGGSYEAPAMQGTSADERTLAREAYFLSFAAKIASTTTVPIMTTGGIKRLSVAQEVIKQNVSLVGMASALAFMPDLPNIWQTKPDTNGFVPKVTWQNKPIAALATMATVRRQLQRLGKQKTPKLNTWPLFNLICDRIRINKLTKRYVAFIKDANVS